MKYMGSKNRHAKQLIPIILERHIPGKWYIEPFVGGANMIDKIPLEKRFGSDIHEHLIVLWTALVSGDFVPPGIVAEDMYLSVRNNRGDYDPALVGFVGFCCSYSGKWFAGYARGNDKSGKSRNYCAESRRNILMQLPNIQTVIFKQKSYLDLHIPDDSTVYCDPPYAKTTKYKSSDFDHEIFWQWVRELSARCNVLVSEYTTPDDFECLWSKEVNNTLTKDTGSKRGVGRLFRYRS